VRQRIGFEYFLDEAMRGIEPVMRDQYHVAVAHSHAERDLNHYEAEHKQRQPHIEAFT